MAHELHDELGQSATALKLRLQLGGQAPPQPSRDTTPQALALVIDQLIARVRRISVDLRPPLLDEVGLGPALRLYLEGQAELSQARIQLEVQPPDGTRLAPDLEIACFRVVQESITNALRHAAARRIQVRLVRDPDRVSLAIRDDGRGFDPAALAGADLAGHLGIVGMRERVRGRAGLFRLTSRPGAGTSVEIDLPISAP